MVDSNLIFYIAEAELNLQQVKETNHIEKEVEQAKEDLKALRNRDPEVKVKDFKRILYNAMVSRRSL